MRMSTPTWTQHLLSRELRRRWSPPRKSALWLLALDAELAVKLTVDARVEDGLANTTASGSAAGLAAAVSTKA